MKGKTPAAARRITCCAVVCTLSVHARSVHVIQSGFVRKAGVPVCGIGCVITCKWRVRGCWVGGFFEDSVHSLHSLHFAIQSSEVGEQKWPVWQRCAHGVRAPISFALLGHD